jgi:hypothetical protein
MNYLKCYKGEKGMMKIERENMPMRPFYRLPNHIYIEIPIEKAEQNDRDYESMKVHKWREGLLNLLLIVIQIAIPYHDPLPHLLFPLFR